jgi:ribonuclease P protein component
VGNAVQRNRVKRWLREIVRVASAPPGGPWDLVFIPQVGILDAGFQAVTMQVGDLLGRVRA